MSIEWNEFEQATHREVSPEIRDLVEAAPFRNFGSDWDDELFKTGEQIQDAIQFWDGNSLVLGRDERVGELLRVPDTLNADLVERCTFQYGMRSQLNPVELVSLKNWIDRRCAWATKARTNHEAWLTQIGKPEGVTISQPTGVGILDCNATFGEWRIRLMQGGEGVVWALFNIGGATIDVSRVRPMLEKWTKARQGLVLSSDLMQSFDMELINDTDVERARQYKQTQLGGP